MQFQYAKNERKGKSDMTQKEINQQVAATILQQLGGREFLSITGSKVKYCSDDKGKSYLMLSLYKNKLKAKYLKIVLEWDDTYTMEFIKEKHTVNKEWSLPGIKKVYDTEFVTAKKIEGVYCDMLQDIFEENTGLYATLFPRH